MKRILFTGLLTLDKEEHGHQFGFVGATSSPSEDGNIRISLGLRATCLVLSKSQDFISLYFPESWADELSRKVRESVIRIRQLRALSKRGLLNENAYHEADVDFRNADMLEELIGSNDKLLGAPRPDTLCEIRFYSKRKVCMVSYIGENQTKVRLHFIGVDSIKIDAKTPGASASPNGLLEKGATWIFLLNEQNVARRFCLDFGDSFLNIIAIKVRVILAK